MKRRLPFFFRQLVSLAAGAVLSAYIHSRVTSFTSEAQPRIAAPLVPPRQVEIYRSHGDFQRFRELGIITLRLRDMDLPWIYERFRKDAGEQGAEAVIDVRVTGETHPELESVQRCTDSSHCDADGRCDPHQNCWTDWVSRDVTTFLATGTMIRRKE